MGKVQGGVVAEAILLQMQGDEKPAHPAVAIPERMDGLELIMDQPCLDQGGEEQLLIAHEAIEIVHGGRDQGGWRRYIDGIGDAAPGADIHGSVPELARLQALAARLIEHLRMEAAQQRGIQRQVLDQFQSQVDGPQGSGDLS